MVEQLRRDGEPGSAPLPKLVRRSPAESLPLAPSEMFSTFDDWLTGHVDRMIEQTTVNLTTSMKKTS